MCSLTWIISLNLHCDALHLDHELKQLDHSDHQGHTSEGQLRSAWATPARFRSWTGIECESCTLSRSIFVCIFENKLWNYCIFHSLILFLWATGCESARETRHRKRHWCECWCIDLEEVEFREYVCIFWGKFKYFLFFLMGLVVLVNFSSFLWLLLLVMFELTFWCVWRNMDDRCRIRIITNTELVTGS